LLDLVSRFLHDHAFVLMCFTIVGGLTCYICHARWRRVRKREQIAREVEDALLQNAQGLILKVHGIVKDLAATDPMRQRVERALDRADEQLSEDRERVQDLRVETLDDTPLHQREAHEDAHSVTSARDESGTGTPTRWRSRVLRWLRFERRK
jgi:signal transduction histidine kinase